MPIRILFIILLVLTTITAQQKKSDDPLKKQAMAHMTAGRYGEAIDLLNKYISSNPRESDGYNLRALCFEKRTEYNYAVLDFRRAIKLSPNNNEYQKNLDRVISIWYKILDKKIEGHKREIAIDPANPFNYLEIGKSYRNKEEWILAEEWYDRYLEKDKDASPDEIIRYSEILAKNGSITKGEKILKIYVDRYPEDWRLWSRYGYFTLWLGKYKIAEEAFTNALEIKPFFLEAKDGLDLATKNAYVTQQDPRAFEKEYPIDRYYRMLRANPDDDESRFRLVDELIKAERIEEAYQQLIVLGTTYSGDPRFEEKWAYVTDFRDNVYRNRIEMYQERLAKNPLDKEAVKKLAEYYEYLQEYDNAMMTLDDYFNQVPNETDPQLRFQYARVSAWGRDFEKAIVIMDNLLNDYPNNLDYQLFRSQLSIWNNRDVEVAREYLTNILEKQPNNFDALVAMGSLKVIDRDFIAAQEYADRAKEIDPRHNDVITLQSNIDFQKMRVEEERIFGILQEGREMVLNDDCAGALPYYEDYLSQAEPNALIYKEYGDVLFCAQEYEQALRAYDDALADGYYFDAALQRAKVLYTLRDSVKAVEAFQELVRDEPDNFEANLYLGDSYAQLGESDSARNKYEELLTWDLDSIEVEMVELRQSWLPVTGLSAIFATFPNYIGFAPSVSAYSDNIGFRYLNYGGRLELGVNTYLSLGTSFYRAHVGSTNADITFTTFKGHIFLSLLQNLRFGVGIGSTNIGGFTNREALDASVSYEKPDVFRLSATYTAAVAAILLYSPDLIFSKFGASILRFDGKYVHPSKFMISSYFQYLRIGEADPDFGDNQGNDFQLRLGRFFWEDLAAGYEYFYQNYRYDSDFYYSPIDFNSHSIWADWYLENQKDLRLIIGGKLGYVPESDFVILQANGELFYRILENLQLSGNVAGGSTSRDNTSYRFVSFALSLYWNFL